MSDDYARIRVGPKAIDEARKSFATVSNAAARDKRISRKARGLLIEILSHKDGFGFSVAALVANGPEGEKSIRSGLKELEKFGYLKRKQVKDPKTGFYKHVEWWVTDMPEGLARVMASENRRSEPVGPNRQADEDREQSAETDNSSDVTISGDGPFGHAVEGHADNAAHKKTTFEEDHAFAAPQAVQKTPPPPPSSVGAGEDAPAEPPLEEDEEMSESKTDDDGSAIAGTASRDERELLEDAGSAVRLPVGFEEVRVVLDRLPRLEAAHVTTEGRLWGKIVEALGSGWDPVALAKVLTRHTDADKARSVRVLPDWYANAFDELPERPVKPVVPLCDNPAHQLNPQEDPVNGGCLLCNTQAATGPREKTTVASDTVRDPQDDGVAFGQAFRADLRAKRLLRTAEPSRSDTPQVRAHREAERNRVKANDLLRTER